MGDVFLFFGSPPLSLRINIRIKVDGTFRDVFSGISVGIEGHVLITERTAKRVRQFNVFVTTLTFIVMHGYHLRKQAPPANGSSLPCTPKKG